MEHHPAAVVTTHSPVGQLYTTDEVAQLLRVSQRTVQVWIRDRDAYSRPVWAPAPGASGGSRDLRRGAD